MNYELSSIEPQVSNTNKEFSEKTLTLEDFPQEVTELFDSLSEPIKQEILNKLQPSEMQQDEFEDIISTLTPETRQELMSILLEKLFYAGNFKDYFESMEGEDLQKTIERLLEVLWENRDKGENVTLFNQAYYQEFFAKREVMQKEIEAKKEEISTTKDAISKKKGAAYDLKLKLQRQEAELEKLEKILTQYDDKNQNSNYEVRCCRDVGSREKKEKRWTKAIGDISAYLPPEDFASLVENQLKEKTFYRQKSIADLNEGEQWHGHEVSDEVRTRAKQIIESISNAIDSWYEEHCDDTVSKNLEDLASESEEKARKEKIINYLIQLMKYYKNSDREDSEKDSTTKLMKVSLNLLKRYQ